ncbi:AAA family ATPase [Peribacillus sp. SCS-26]|uniref:AAA family ATPase n=1 Tax=Paraperibacillus marinus TaxID=3115295 RepID=UPI003905E314
MAELLRLPAEKQYEEELHELKKHDEGRVPAGWRMSPRSVLTFIAGGTAGSREITPKYIGSRRLIEMAIASLMTDRALLLIGEPGTAKSLLSELLTAAVHGDSGHIIQGTAGTTEDQIRYSWNYAMLLANGPSRQALVKSPVFRAMENGYIARFEEISRCSSEVQDAFISILSEKTISIPELNEEVSAVRGFSVIGTANTRDRGVNEMSSALKRRFNILNLPVPGDMETELEIVRKRVGELSDQHQLQAEFPQEEMVEKVVTIFRELRSGMTLDRKEKLKPPSGVISTAEAISLLTNSMALSGSFGSGQVTDLDLAASLQGTIVKDDAKDGIVWKEYLENVMKKKGSEWRSLYLACSELNG